MSIFICSNNKLIELNLLDYFCGATISSHFLKVYIGGVYWETLY